MDELNELMREHSIRHVLIIRGTEVVGVVSERDPVTVSAEARLDEVAFEMSKRKIGSVIVNEGNKLLGIFTVTDALNALIEIARVSRETK